MPKTPVVVTFTVHLGVGTFPSVTTSLREEILFQLQMLADNNSDLFRSCQCWLESNFSQFGPFIENDRVMTLIVWT